MHNKFDIAYLKMAQEWAKLSYCKRKQVGALIVKDRTIIADGYNGTPSGFENCCEDENYETKWYVLHAEANAILKISRNRECSKLILQAGIKRLVYIDDYSDSVGLEFLRNAGLEILKISQEELQNNVG